MPLLILGSAVALVIAKLASAVTYETILQLAIGAEHRDQLASMEMLTLDADDPDEVLSTVVYHFDREHRPSGELQHTLRLTAGDYVVVFRFRQSDGRIHETRKTLQVSSDSSIRLAIP